MKKIKVDHFGKDSIFHVQVDDGIVALYKNGVFHCNVSCDLSKADPKLVEASAKLPEGVFYYDAASDLFLAIQEVAVNCGLIERVEGYPIVSVSYAAHLTYRVAK